MKIKNLSDKLIWAAIIAYAAFFSYVSILKYNNFIYNDFDLAIDAQTLWNICHGSLYSSIHQMVFLGNHMRVILFLIAPLYAIFQSPILLLVLQSVALGLGAYPIYKIASEELGKKIALVFAFAYLFYPALGYLNLYEFHPTALATCFLLFMLYYFKKNKFSLFLIFAILAMSCQENIALALIMISFYALVIKKPLKWVIVSFLLGFIYFWFCISFAQPYFNKGNIPFLSLYGHLGGMVFHPVSVLRFMLTSQKAIFLLQLFAPLCFMSFFAPLILMAGLPFFLQHLLSLRARECFIYYHYTAELIPFVFISAIYGAKKLFNFNIFKKYAPLILIAVVIISNILICPYFYLLSGISMFTKDSLVCEKEKMVKEVPADASVVATFQFLPKLSNRSQLYSFHHIYTGITTLSDFANPKTRVDYVTPQDIEYALIDFNDPLTFQGFYCPQGYKNIKKFLKNGDFGILDKSRDIFLFKRGYKGSSIIEDVVNDNGKIKILTKNV